MLRFAFRSNHGVHSGRTSLWTPSRCGHHAGFVVLTQRARRRTAPVFSSVDMVSRLRTALAIIHLIRVDHAKQDVNLIYGLWAAAKLQSPSLAAVHDQHWKTIVNPGGWEASRQMYTKNVLKICGCEGLSTSCPHIFITFFAHPAHKSLQNCLSRRW